MYFISVIFIGLLVSPTDTRLFGASGTAASPFVIALEDAGIKGLPDFLNIVILFAVVAVGAESVFIASRILRAMAHQRLIPGWLAKVDKKGRPIPSLLITTGLGIIFTYMNLSASGITVFSWLANISSTGFFAVWIVIVVTSFRFHAAVKAQNDPIFKQIYAWRCTLWPLPPIWLGACCMLFTGCSIYVGLYPIVSEQYCRVENSYADLF